MVKDKKEVKPKKQLVPRTRNAGTFTESEYFGKLRGGLRQAFRWWKPMQMALDAASRPSRSKNKRLKKEYQCKKCSKWFARKDVEIHHKIPCGSLQTYDDIVPFIKRLAAEEVSAYEIVCKPCHKKITLLEKNGKREKKNICKSI